MPARSSPSNASGVDRLRLRADEQAWKRRELLELQTGDIGAIGVAVEGRVEIGAGIGDHVDPADLEAGAVVIIGGRRLALPKIANVRPRQALIGGHARLDQVTEVDELFRDLMRHKAQAPISSQITFKDADGMAPCHQPLTANPAAPTTFMPW